MQLEHPSIEPMPERFRKQDMTLTEIEGLWDSVGQPTVEDTEMWHKLCRDIRASADRYIRIWYKHEDAHRQSFGDVDREMLVDYDRSRRTAHTTFIANCHGLSRLARLNQIDDHWLRWGKSWLDILGGGDADRDDPQGRAEFADHAVKIVAQTIREGEENKYASGNQSLAG